MLGITPAWFLYISLLCLLAETRGRTGEGIGTRNSRTSFQENRSQGSARTGGDVDQALQELQGQTGEVYVQGTSVRKCLVVIRPIYVLIVVVGLSIKKTGDECCLHG